MATVNKSRFGGMHKKRASSFFAARIKTRAGGDFGTSGDVYQLAQLPENILVLAYGATVLTPNNDTGTATADLKIGATTLLDDVNLKSAAGTSLAPTPSVTNDGAGTDPVDDLQTPISFPTGGIVTFTPTYANSDATAGEVLLWIEYLEYDKTDGELTSFVA